MKRFIVLAVTVFFVIGCATPSQQTKTEGTAGGAIIGAVIGGIIGHATGDENGAKIGAALGAAIGGAAGYAYADSINKRREELAGKENDLDARIEFARGVNKDTQEFNKRLEKEKERLAAKINQKQMTSQELEKERKALKQKVKVANEQLAKAEKVLQEIKDFQAKQPQESDELDAEIGRLEGNLAQVRRNTSELASLSQRI